MDATSGAGARSALTARDLAVVTVSYRGDLDLARELCRSLDTFLPRGAEHLLVVPKADVALFEPLLGPGRRVVPVEEVLPGGYTKLPVPHTLRIGPLRKRIREIWLTPAGPARGWIVQQIVKLSVPTLTDREIVAFADSDIVLVAPLTIERLAEDGQVRLYQVPGAAADLPAHLRWHDVSSRLLGLEPRGYLGSDFIGNLITWRRSAVLRLQDRITEVAGRRWDAVIARQRHFSEYILYGAFVDLVLGHQAAGHFPSPEDLVHAGWFYDLRTDQGIEAFLCGFSPGQVGVAIQSTERFTLDERRHMVDRIATGVRPEAGE